MNNILFLFLYNIKYFFGTSDTIASHTQSFCKVLFWKVA